MYIEKYLLTDIVGGTPLPDSTLLVSQNDEANVGIVNDSVYIYNAPGRLWSFNEMSRISLSLIHNFSVIPSQGPFNNNSDDYAPDNFVYASYMAYVPLPAPPVAAAPNTSGQVIW